MTPVMGLLMWAKVTAYVPMCEGCTGTMADGRKADPELGVVATNKSWPLGTCVSMLQDDGSWRQFEVADRLGKRTRQKAGSWRHIDMLVGSVAEAREHGVKQVLVMPVPCECSQ